MPASSAANSQTYQVTTPGEREIILTRLFDAPRELVFDAMSKPEHIVRWWGNLGDGYSVPVCDVDLRVGGTYRFVNRHPGGEVAFHGEYMEIDRPSRLVFTETMEPFPPPGSVVTAEFTEESGKTRLTARVLYPSREIRDMVISSGMARGAGISYDRLDDLLQELKSGR